MLRYQDPLCEVSHRSEKYQGRETDLRCGCIVLETNKAERTLKEQRKFKFISEGDSGEALASSDTGFLSYEPGTVVPGQIYGKS